MGNTGVKPKRIESSAEYDDRCRMGDYEGDELNLWGPDERYNFDCRFDYRFDFRFEAQVDRNDVPGAFKSAGGAMCVATLALYCAARWWWRRTRDDDDEEEEDDGEEKKEEEQESSSFKDDEEGYAARGARYWNVRRQCAARAE
jgi:hypothetical protein